MLRDRFSNKMKDTQGTISELNVVILPSLNKRKNRH